MRFLLPLFFSVPLLFAVDGIVPIVLKSCASSLLAFNHVSLLESADSIWTFTGASEPGPHGGLLYTAHLSEIAQKEGYETSAYPDHPAAPEGGVKKVIDTLGQVISDFLGLSKTEKTAVVPDAAATNAAIEKINTQLVDPIAQRFYQAKVSQVKRREYVLMQSLGQIPQAPPGSVMMHDTAYHLTAMLLMPPALAKRNIQLNKMLVEFVKFLEEKMPYESKVKYLPYINSLYQLMLETDDFAQGNISISISGSTENKNEIRELLQAYTGYGQSTNQYLALLHKNAVASMPLESRGPLEYLLSTFQKEHPEFDNDALVEDPSNLWCDQIYQRKIELAAAIRKLQK